MSEHTPIVRVLKAAGQAICGWLGGSWPGGEDDSRQVAREDSPRERFLRDLAARRPRHRSRAQGSFRYLQLDACDH